MASELTVFQGVGLAKTSAGVAAACNDPVNSMTVSEIEKARREPIDPQAFAVCMTLICSRYEKKSDKALFARFYQRLSVEMGHTEFLAAFYDLEGAEVFYAQVLPYLLKHVRNQRDNGPDLLHLSMAEVYARGRGEPVE